MKIKLIDFGVPEHQRPYRPHGNDAGADVICPMTVPYSPRNRQNSSWLWTGNTGWICGIYLSPYQHGGKRSGL